MTDESMSLEEQQSFNNILKAENELAIAQISKLKNENDQLRKTVDQYTAENFKLREEVSTLRDATPSFESIYRTERKLRDDNEKIAEELNRTKLVLEGERFMTSGLRADNGRLTGKLLKREVSYQAVINRFAQDETNLREQMKEIREDERKRCIKAAENAYTIQRNMTAYDQAIACVDAIKELRNPE